MLVPSGAAPTKFVVFSQFTKFLDLLGPALASAGHGYCRLDGSMSSARRKQAMTAFRDDREVGTRQHLNTYLNTYPCIPVAPVL